MRLAVKIVSCLAIMSVRGISGVCQAQIVATNYTLLSRQALGGARFQETISVTFRNTGLSVFGASANPSSLVSCVTILSGQLALGDLISGATATPAGGILVQIDKSDPRCSNWDGDLASSNNPSKSYQRLGWTLTDLRAVIGLVEYVNSGDARIGRIDFNNGDNFTLLGDKSPDGTPQMLRAAVAIENGATTELTYNPSGQINSLATPSGYGFQFTWTASNITSVTLTTPAGDKVTAPLDLAASIAAAGTASASAANTSAGSGAAPPSSMAASITAAAQPGSVASTCEGAIAAVAFACQASGLALGNATLLCLTITGSIAALRPAYAANAPEILAACEGAAVVAVTVCKVTGWVNYATAPICAAVEAVVNTLAFPSVTLTATPTSLPTGQYILLSWSSKYADYCSASGNGSVLDLWDGPVLLIGQQRVTEQTAGPYTYEVTCFSGSQQSQASATVTFGNALNNDTFFYQISIEEVACGVTASGSVTVTGGGQTFSGSQSYTNNTCGPGTLGQPDAIFPPVPIALQPGVTYTAAFSWNGTASTVETFVIGALNSAGQFLPPPLAIYGTGYSNPGGQISQTFVAQP